MKFDTFQQISCGYLLLQFIEHLPRGSGLLTGQLQSQRLLQGRLALGSVFEPELGGAQIKKPLRILACSCTQHDQESFVLHRRRHRLVQRQRRTDSAPTRIVERARPLSTEIARCA